eukprot:s3577_g6.t1
MSTENASLAARYARMVNPTLHHSLEELRAMPLEQMEDLVVDFGKAMKGKSHKAFLLFVDKYVSQAEQIEKELLRDEGVSEPAPRTLSARPKPKVAPRGTKAASSNQSPTDQWDLLSVSGETEPALDNQVSALATRMTQVEHVMEQVLVAIQQMQIQPPAP